MTAGMATTIHSQHSMFILENHELRVSLLNPATDTDRLGSRYVTGGYIWQIADLRHGPLMSGPEYPSTSPSPTNGQGAPEVFQFTCFHDERDIPEKRLIVGVGTVENDLHRGVNESHWHSRVEQPARWDVLHRESEVSFSTIQAYGAWSLRLTKTVELRGRTVVSTSDLLNTGHGVLPFRWFAHPFFPLNADLRCFRMQPGWDVEHNPGFAAGAGDWLAMRPDYDWAAGHFELVRGASGQTLAIQLAHPLVGSVRITGDFPLFRVALWANDRTFSLEPFRAGSIPSGEAVRWFIEYAF